MTIFAWQMVSHISAVTIDYDDVIRC